MSYQHTDKLGTTLTFDLGGGPDAWEVLAVRILHPDRTGTTYEIPLGEVASAMLGMARTAGWKTHGETKERIDSGSVEDWQADAVASLRGAIRKAADDKVKAEAEAEELEHAAHLLAAASPAFTLGDARHQLQTHENIRRTWLKVARAARAQFAPSTCPF